MNIHGLGLNNSSDILRYFNGLRNNSSVNFSSLLSAITQETENVAFCAEQYLRGLYPDLRYHVVDSSGFEHFNRLDFPVHLLYKDTIDDNVVEYLNSWKPTRQNATGFEPDVQRNLMTIQRGANVVLIHPKTQQRMNNDPEYAKIIANKIQSWFEHDYSRNKAFDPESANGIVQLICVNEDGELGFRNTVTWNDEIKKNDDILNDNAGKQEKKSTQQSQLHELTQLNRGVNNYSFNYGLYAGMFGTGKKDKHQDQEEGGS